VELSTVITFSHEKYSLYYPFIVEFHGLNFAVIPGDNFSHEKYI